MEAAAATSPHRPDQPNGWLVAVGFGLALANNYLMFSQLPGLGFSLFTLAVVLTIALLGPRLVGRPMPRTAGWLLSGVVFFGAMLSVQADELVALLNMAAIVYLGLAVVVLWRGQPLTNLTVGRAAALWLMPIEFVIRAFGPLATALTNPLGRVQSAQQQAIIRGGLITLPILAVVLLLLGSADLIVGTYLERLLDLANWSLEPEMIGRLFQTGVAGLFFTGALAAASQPAMPGPADPVPAASKPALGTTEQIILLGSLATAFGGFILLQLRYLFLGASTLPLGYTYAEYARRGFIELIVVAGLAFLILWAGRTRPAVALRSTRWVDGLRSGLLIEVLVILLTAAKRLMLYEQAYGFTVARFVAHASILWLGALLLVFGWFVLHRAQPQRFGQLWAGSFVLSLVLLNLINPDVFVARQNFARAQRTGQLDIGYVAYDLSVDALPLVVRETHSVGNIYQQLSLMKALAGRQMNLEADRSGRDWQSWQWAETRALRALRADREFLSRAKEFSPSTYVCHRPEAAGEHYAAIPSADVR